jgi:hypothetical protein
MSLLTATTPITTHFTTFSNGASSVRFLRTTGHRLLGKDNGQGVSFAGTLLKDQKQFREIEAFTIQLCLL